MMGIKYVKLEDIFNEPYEIDVDDFIERHPETAEASESAIGAMAMLEAVEKRANAAAETRY